MEIVKISLLYVGGTIGMKKNKDGVYVPIPGEFYGAIKINPQLHDTNLATRYFPDLKSSQLVLPQIAKKIITYEIKEYVPLLDSSNMTPQQWIKIAEDIGKNYNNFNGFVILHGTDTLVYTSSALSFMLEGLTKPVIVTGSLIPIYEARNDGLNNILTSLVLASCYNIPEVCVYFGNKLLRANRTVKLSSSKFDAFTSPKYSPLAVCGAEIEVNNDSILQSSKIPFRTNTNLNPNVAVLTFSPTITPLIIEVFLDQSLSGAVIQTYGVGNIPSNCKEIVDILKAAVKRNIVIVNISSCLEGSVSTKYETGKVLEDIGIVPGYDMTLEAAVTKLCVVLGNAELTFDEKVELMKQNIRGELTPSSANNEH